MSENKNEIELRSEKVRSIVGRIPPMLLRYGIAIISLIIIMVIILAYTIPYPQYISSSLQLYCSPSYETIIAPDDGIVHINMNDSGYSENNLGKFKTKDSTYLYLLPENSSIIFSCKDLDIVKKGEDIYTTISDSITKIYGIIHIESDHIAKIKIGMKVSFKSATNLALNQQLAGYVSEIYPVPTIESNNNQQLYKVEIAFDKDTTRKMNFTPGIIGTAEILVSEQPILKKIFGL